MRGGAEIGDATQPFRLLVKYVNPPSCCDHPVHKLDGKTWHGCGQYFAGGPRSGALNAHLNAVGSAAGLPEEIVVNNIVSKVTIFGPAVGWVQCFPLPAPQQERNNGNSLPSALVSPRSLGQLWLPPRHIRVPSTQSRWPLL